MLNKIFNNIMLKTSKSTIHPMPFVIPDEYFNEKKEVYVSLKDAEIIERHDGSITSDLTYETDYPVVIILKLDEKYYFLVKHPWHSALQFTCVGDMRNQVYIKKCKTLDKAKRLAEEQMQFWN